jgi:hypothetical protein
VRCEITQKRTGHEHHENEEIFFGGTFGRFSKKDFWLFFPHGEQQATTMTAVDGGQEKANMRKCGGP